MTMMTLDNFHYGIHEGISQASIYATPNAMESDLIIYLLAFSMLQMRAAKFYCAHSNVKYNKDQSKIARPLLMHEAYLRSRSAARLLNSCQCHRHRMDPHQRGGACDDAALRIDTRMPAE